MKKKVKSGHIFSQVSSGFPYVWHDSSRYIIFTGFFPQIKVSFCRYLSCRCISFVSIHLFFTGLFSGSICVTWLEAILVFLQISLHRYTSVFTGLSPQIYVSFNRSLSTDKGVFYRSLSSRFMSVYRSLLGVFHMCDMTQGGTSFFTYLSPQT